MPFFFSDSLRERERKNNNIVLQKLKNCDSSWWQTYKTFNLLRNYPYWRFARKYNILTLYARKKNQGLNHKSRNNVIKNLYITWPVKAKILILFLTYWKSKFYVCLNNFFIEFFIFVIFSLNTYWAKKWSNPYYK